MCFGKIKENDKFNFENISQEVVILVFTIDNKLFLDYRVKEICRKASQKTWAFSRISNYSGSKIKEILLTGMARSQFIYYPLNWVLSSRKSNNLIKKVHKRSIRVVTVINIAVWKVYWVGVRK